MSVDFGLALLAGPPAGRTHQWLDDLDVSLPLLEGHFRSLWMTDHFFWGGEPTYEAWTTLSFLAARFPAYELGPMVLGQSYRNPALLALMAATLQALSGGRFIMGIGAGWKEDEYHAYGYDYPRPGIRIEQLEETVQIFKKMWTEPGPVSFEGKHYQIKDAWCEPRPHPVPPIIVGGGGRKTMLVAARHADMWNVSDTPYEQYKERVEILHQHCADIGRDPSTLRKSWFGRVALGRTEEEAEARGLSRTDKWTRDRAFIGTPESVAEQMLRYVDLGCDYFMIDVIGIPNPDVMRMLLEELLPAVRGE